MQSVRELQTRILVLGGDGYLGWPTAMYLSRRGHSVAVMDNFAKRRWEVELNEQTGLKRAAAQPPDPVVSCWQRPTSFCVRAVELSERRLESMIFPSDVPRVAHDEPISDLLRGAAPPHLSCTIVICTRGRAAQLDRCLEAVSRIDCPHLDVLVVGNAPADTCGQQVAARWNARYIVEPRLGLSRARNAGARACNTDIIAYLDDDAVPEDGWLPALLREFHDPLVIAVAGRWVPYEQEEGAIAQSRCSADSDPGERQAVDRDTPFWFERANFGDIAVGTNMAFRRSAFDIWPGFDERLGRGTSLHGNEEHHAFCSLIERGYRVVATPHAAVRHPGPRILADFRSEQSRIVAASAAYITLLFLEKQGHRRAILNFIREALLGRGHPWRSRKQAANHPGLSICGKLLASVSGVLLYVRSQLGSRRIR